MMKEKIKKAIKLTMNFKPGVPRDLKTNLFNYFISISSNYILNISENQVIYSGSLKNNMMEFLTDLSTITEDKNTNKFYPILRSSIECFAFEEELFAEEWKNRTLTNIDCETFSGFEEVYLKLVKIRKYLKNFVL